MRTAPFLTVMLLWMEAAKLQSVPAMTTYAKYVFQDNYLHGLLYHIILYSDVKNKLINVSAPAGFQ